MSCLAATVMQHISHLSVKQRGKNEWIFILIIREWKSSRGNGFYSKFKSPVQIDLAIKTCFDIFVAGLIALWDLRQKRINMQLTFSPRAADEMMAMMFGQRLDFVSGKVAHRHTYKNQIDPLKTPSCPCCAAFGRAGPRFSSHLLSKPQKSLSFHFLVGRSSPGGEWKEKKMMIYKKLPHYVCCCCVRNVW